MQLKSVHSQVLDEFVNAVEASNQECQFAVVIIGSAVRRTEKSQSDLDLLLVGDRELWIPRFHPQPLHVQMIPKDKFLQRLESGDDFVAWSLRFGVPIRGGKYWKTIKDSGQARVWPEWRRKVPQAAHRLAIARSLLEAQDLQSAAEETLYSTSHAARAIRLKDRVFPRSRPEMVGQLKEAGWPDLARLLDTLVKDGADRRLLSGAQHYLKKLLLHLDRPAYSDFVSLRKRTARQKNIVAIDPLAQHVVAGHMKVLLMLHDLVSKAAAEHGVEIRNLEIGPAWSHEDDDRSRVVMDIEVDAEPELRFTYWEAVSDLVQAISDSLSPREKHFVNSTLSILVSRSHAV